MAGTKLGWSVEANHRGGYTGLVISEQALSVELNLNSRATFARVWNCPSSKLFHLKSLNCAPGAAGLLNFLPGN